MTLYRDLIGDEWADYWATLYSLGKGRWGYLVPADPAARATLRDLCRRTLAFENHFLRAYRDHLRAVAREEDITISTAATARLRELRFGAEEARDEPDG